MKILKSLNKIILTFIISFFLIGLNSSKANEPVDIWSLENNQKKNNENLNSQKNNEQSIDEQTSVFDNQSGNINSPTILQDDSLSSENVKIVGLYDPFDNGLSIDMWSNTDGQEIIKIFKKIKKIKLSKDAKYLMNISLLTNAYSPDENISHSDFMELKKYWLINNGDLEILETYLLKNYDQIDNFEILKFLVDEHLSNANLKKSCDTLSKINVNFEDDYLSMFKIYCLVNEKKIEEAQLLLDLKKEQGFKNIFFEDKVYLLMGFKNKNINEVSSENLLNFHLSHKTVSEFNYEPDKKTSKKIWKYLYSYNLLRDLEQTDLEDYEKIKLLEKATNEGSYSERDLFNLYKNYTFSIHQLLDIEENYKLLPKIEARALLYQGILLNTDIDKKLRLTKILKELFIQDQISNAFDNELFKILNNIKQSDIPSDYSSFYNEYAILKDEKSKKIKINNKVLHQSKLLNYFRTKVSTKKIEKDLNDFLKKISKNKDYFLSTKDIILIESLISDGIEIDKKYKNLIEENYINMPKDIQNMIEQNQIGLVLLRLVEVIGQDDIKNIGSETLHFIISALNQLNIDPIRNKILLNVLPLKV
tara:strand:+ start:7520 stop:9289 length:1770 start_codon:yes stop_codon:yes gene_type:complete